MPARCRIFDIFTWQFDLPDADQHEGMSQPLKQGKQSISDSKPTVMPLGATVIARCGKLAICSAEGIELRTLNFPICRDIGNCWLLF